jgi:hypothetical protein
MTEQEEIADLRKQLKSMEPVVKWAIKFADARRFGYDDVPASDDDWDRLNDLIDAMCRQIVPCVCGQCN